MIAVALAGCLTNILLAAFAIFLLQFRIFSADALFSTLLTTVSRINIILASFNLIPIPPLDGSKVLMGFLPEEAQLSLARIEPYGFFIIIFMLFTGLMYPWIDFMQHLIEGVISVILGIFR